MLEKLKDNIANEKLENIEKFKKILLIIFNVLSFIVPAYNSSKTINKVIDEIKLVISYFKTITK